MHVVNKRMAALGAIFRKSLTEKGATLGQIWDIHCLSLALAHTWARLLDRGSCPT